MTDKEKKLYDSIKNKTRQQVKRRVRAVFTDHQKKLKNYTVDQQNKMGAWLQVLEMEVKQAI